jgi:diguanylate cyclase (GGDEF)-like protein/PAS domain S-box-containing protein
VRRFPLRMTLPLGLALLLFTVLGVSLLNAMNKRLGQLDQQARMDILAHTAHLARMAEHGWETSRGLVEADLAEVATDPRAETVLLLDDSGRVMAAHRYAWRGRLVTDVLPGFDRQRFAQVQQGRLPAFFLVSPDGVRVAAMQPFHMPAGSQELRSQKRGIAYVGFDLARERRTMREFVFKARAPDLAATLVMIALLGWLLHRYVASPLEHVAAAANSLRSGRLDVTVPEEGAQEIADLAENFNAMARSMQETQTKLANSELHFRALANSGQALVWTSGLDGGCEYFNEPWLRFTGRTQEQEQGEGWADGVHPDDRSRCLETYQTAFNRRESFSMEYRLRHVSGEYRWIMDQGSPRFDTEGHFLGYVGHCMDVTEAKRAEAEIERLAYHDALTGLPNRVLFLDRLAQALAASRRNRRCGAVLFVDLDQFKRINDVHGHALGDAVLRDVARRLEFYLRQEDTVARLGGDEFVILLPDLAANLGDAGSLVMAVAEKIRSALESPVSIDGQEFVTGASIGITVFPKDAESVDDLMREADTAMYRAKERGRNALAYFEPAMQEAVSERYALDRELREAVRDRCFELHLQSQVNAGGRVIGAEALVRWRHPQRGMVMPTTFIPLAEESGLIVPLGEWVLREACMLIARLDAEGRGMRIAVNVSPRQFHQVNFVQRVKEILSATGADPGYLTLEITENLLVEHASESVARMTELSALGLRFSIDDFGTGYSSLAYLKRLPLSELKIDKSFVQDIPHDPNDVALVETILSMARHLQFEVVAEGVENEAQLAFLHQQGCERFQGYHFQRPMEMRAWVSQLPPANS